MKNLLSLLLTLSVFISKGQDTILNKKSISFEFGPSFTNVRSINNFFDYYDIDIKTSINSVVGVRFEYSFTKWFSYNIGLLYDRKGYNYEYYLTDVDGVFNNQYITGRVQYNYLTLPITTRFKLGNKHKLVHTIGGYGSYLINTYHLSTFGKDDNKSGTNIFDLGLVFGLGGEFILNDKLKLNVEVRNNLGLNNIYYGSENKTLNNSLMIIMGIGYKLL